MKKLIKQLKKRLKAYKKYQKKREDFSWYYQGRLDEIDLIICMLEKNEQIKIPVFFKDDMS